MAKLLSKVKWSVLDKIAMKHKIVWVDAFTDKKFGGNPCAVVFAADDLSAKQMLTFAKEFNLSETAFVVKSNKADFGARYFTPAEEIPLAGHPTIATIHALIEEGAFARKKSLAKVSLELKAGVIDVEINSLDSSSPLIVMSQKKPKFLSTHQTTKIAKLFGLKANDLLDNYPVQTVSTGTPQLMVPLKNHEALRRAAMNVPAYIAYKAKSDFFSPHLFCLEGITSEGQTFARHFGVPPDTAEDAFTGSATGGMAAYLWLHQLIKKPKFVAEQGHWMNRPGKALVEVVGDHKNIKTVKVAGQAVTVFRGEMAEI